MTSFFRIPHVFDDLDATLGELTSLLNDISRGDLESVSEKIDGTPVAFTWDAVTDEVRFAFSTTEVKSGGSTIDALFTGTAVGDPFVRSLRNLEGAVSEIQNLTKVAVFGSNARNWFIVDVVLCDAPRRIKYREDAIVLHDFPCLERRSPESVVVIESTCYVPSTRLARALAADGQHRVRTQMTPKNLGPHAMVLSSKNSCKALLVACVAAQNALEIMRKQNGHLGDDCTLREVVRFTANKEIYQDIWEHINGADATMIADTIAQRVCGARGSLRLNDIKKLVRTPTRDGKTLPRDVQDKLLTRVREREAFQQKILHDLERSFYDVECLLFKDVSSTLVSAPKDESQRLGDAFHDALEDADDDASRAYVQDQIDASVSSHVTDIAPLEGIVFSWRDRAYKITGQFRYVRRVLNRMHRG